MSKYQSPFEESLLHVTKYEFRKRVKMTLYSVIIRVLNWMERQLDSSLFQ